MFRKGSGRAGTDSSMVLKFTLKLNHLPILENENVFLYQIVNKDSIKPQAKKIFHK